MAWAIEYQDLPIDQKTGRIRPSCKSVLMALANRASPTGTDAFPSEAEIQQFTGLSIRMIQYSLHELEAHGTIRPTPNPLVRARTITNADRWPNSWDLVAFPGYRTDDLHGVQDLPPQGHARSPRGARSHPKTAPRGARSAKNSQVADCDLAPEPVLQNLTPTTEPTPSEKSGDFSGHAQRGAPNPHPQNPSAEDDLDLFKVSGVQGGQATRKTRTKTVPNGTVGEREETQWPDDLGGGRDDPPPPGDGPTVTAQHVTAAWVDGFRAERPRGVTPNASLRGQASKLGKELLEAGNNPQAVLRAARSAGAAGSPRIDLEFARLTSRHTTSARSARRGSWGWGVNVAELPRDDWRRFSEQ
jgi:hypothetical protein